MAEGIDWGWYRRIGETYLAEAREATGIRETALVAEAAKYLAIADRVEAIGARG